jgi:hypothetical protein
MGENEMTLLEAAERLLVAIPGGQWEYGLCRFCECVDGRDHTDDCPWLAVENTVKRERRRLDCKHDSWSDNGLRCLECGYELPF